jgi:hypothetical protein
MSKNPYDTEKNEEYSYTHGQIIKEKPKKKTFQFDF